MLCLHPSSPLVLISPPGAIKKSISLSQGGLKYLRVSSGPVCVTEDSKLIRSITG